MIFLLDEFPEHPKTIAAGPEAAMVLIALIGYANRYLTGGMIPATHPRIVGRGARHAKKLIAVNYLHAPGHACPNACPQPAEGWYVIHDYDEHNHTALAKRQARSEKASNAAKARWQKAAHEHEPSSAASNAPSIKRGAPTDNGSARLSPPSDEKQGEEPARNNAAAEQTRSVVTAGQSATTDAPSIAPAMPPAQARARGPQPPTPPTPTDACEPTSSSSRPSPSIDDDDGLSALQRGFDEAADLIAADRLRRRTVEKGPVADPDAWKAEAARRAFNDVLAASEQLGNDAHPDDLASWVITRERVPR